MDDHCKMCGEPVELVEIFSRELYDVGDFVCEDCEFLFSTDHPAFN